MGLFICFQEEFSHVPLHGTTSQGSIREEVKDHQGQQCHQQQDVSQKRTLIPQNASGQPCEEVADDGKISGTHVQSSAMQAAQVICILITF